MLDQHQVELMNLREKELNERRAAEQEQYDTRTKQNNEKLKQELFAQDKQSDQQRFALEQDRINKQAQLQEDALDIEQKLDERQYADQAISAQQFLANQRTRADARLQIEQDTVDAIHQASVQFTDSSEKMQQDLTERVAKAAQKRSDTVAEIDQKSADMQLQDIQKRYGTVQQLLEARVTAQQQAPPTEIGLPSGALTDLIASLRAQLADLQAQKETAQIGMATGLTATTPQQFVQMDLAIQHVNDQLIKFGEELRKITDMGSLIGMIASELGKGVSQIYTSRFARGLGTAVGAGTGLLGQASVLGAQLAVPISTKIDDKTKLPVPTTLTDQMDILAKKVTAAVQALEGFIESIRSAHSALGGAAGGVLGGAGLGSTISKALGPDGAKLMSAEMAKQMPMIGAALGMVLGAITGQKERDIQNELTNFTNQFNQIMQQYAVNNANLQQTITALQSLEAEVAAQQASTKKKGSQFQQTINQYNQQIQQLQDQQAQIIVQMQEAAAVLQASQGVSPMVSTGLQSTLSQLQQIVVTYNQAVGAIQPGINATQQLATANNNLVQSLQNLGQTMETQVEQDNVQAINDAINLNNLMLQRIDYTNQINTQIEGVLSQGVLTRQGTRAQTAGEQIQQIQVQAQQQLEQMNEEISVAQYKVAAEQQIFGLATTRIGLESQLLILQEAQAGQQISVIQATMELLQQMQAGNFSYGPIAAILAAVPSASNPAVGVANGTQFLEALWSSAYGNRGSMGYSQYSGANL
jgi:hypothetical protein